MAETKLQSKSADKMLLLKDAVSVELNVTGSTGQGSPTGNTAGTGSPLAGSPGAVAAAWIGTIPVYNENGLVVGYIPLLDTADLT